MTRKLLSILLCSIMLVSSLIPIAATAAPEIPEGYTKVGESGRLELYFYEKEPSIIVLDKQTSFQWKSSITEQDYDMKDVNAVWKNNMKSLFSFSYVNFKDSKSAITATNSIAAKPKVTTKKVQNGISLVHDFSTIKMSITVDITLENDSLNVKIPADGITEGDQYGLITIELMPFFGAAKDDKEGYIFYPDGSGALLNFKNTSHIDANKYSWYIYGQDKVDFEAYRDENRLGLQQAMVPVFGIKQGNSSVAAIVAEGDTDSAINLYPSGYVVNLNRISPEFTYRRSFKDPRPNSKTANLTGTRIEKEIVKQDHSVRYVFLGNDQSNYSGMANAYRKYLKDGGNLKQAIKPGEKMQMGLDFFMGINEERLLYDKYIPMTTFNQAKKIIEEFQNKNVNNLQIQLIGWTDAGYGTFPIVIPPSKALGGDKDLKKLAEYANSKSNKLYLEANFVDALKENGEFSTRNDVVYDRNKLVVTSSFKDRFLLSPVSAWERFLKLFLPKVKNYGISGVNFTRFGDIIYYDYNEKQPSTRSQTKDYWEQFFNESINSFGSTASQGGNAYVLKYSDRLSNIPEKDSEYFITDETIPFYQMVVHGSIPYSSSPGNLFHDPQRQKLKWVEYGSMPYFKLTHEQSGLLKNTGYNLLFSSYYLDWLDTAVQIYSEFDKRLGDLWGQPITKHEKLQADIFKVTYQNGTAVYINYKEQPVTIEGNTIKALDYLVVEKGGSKK